MLLHKNGLINQAFQLHSHLSVHTSHKPSHADNKQAREERKQRLFEKWFMGFLYKYTGMLTHKFLTCMSIKSHGILKFFNFHVATFCLASGMVKIEFPVFIRFEVSLCYVQSFVYF